MYEVVDWLDLFSSSGCSSHSHAFFTDPGALTATATLVEQFGAAHLAGFIQHNGVNIGRIEREQTLNADSVRDLANGEACSMTLALPFDHIAFKRLDTFFVSFYDLVIHGNIVPGFEFRVFFLTAQLLMYKGDRAHNLQF